MTQCILNDLDIHTSLTHPSGEGMPQTVTTEMRKQHGILLTSQHGFIITIANDSAKCFVECSLMLWLTKSIYENEIGIAINSCFTSNASDNLILLFLLEGFLHKLEHWNLSNTIYSLWRMNITVTTIHSVSVIDQRVVDINHPVFKVNITPAKTNSLSHTKSCSYHYCKDRIPVLVFRRTAKIIQKQVLLFLCQCPSLLTFHSNGLLQFFQNIVRRIATNIAIIFLQT